MKKLFILLLIYSFLVPSIFSQISDFPHNEGFEDEFIQGNNVNFLPNWWGNYVTNDTIYRDDTRPYSGSYNLTMIPKTEELLTIVQADLDLSGKEMMVMEFWVATDSNGTGQKNARLFTQLSIDSGATWLARVEIADQSNFPNAPTLYSRYFYAFHPSSLNKENVKCRIVGKTGAHPGLAAKVFIDNLTFFESSVDSFPPIAMEPKIINPSKLLMKFSEPVGISAEDVANYVISNNVNIESATRSAGLDSVFVLLSEPLEEGIYYTLTLSNIKDLSENIINEVEFELLFNTVSSGLVVSEILYNTPFEGEEDNLEFIEIYNATCEAIQLGGLRVKPAIQSHFLPSYLLAPGEYYLLVKDNEVFESVFGFPANLEWRGGDLDDSGNEFIGIFPAGHHAGLIDSVLYQISEPWPIGGSGTGASIELCNKFLDNSLGSSWQTSIRFAGVYQEDSIYASPGIGCDPNLNPILDLGENIIYCGIDTLELDAGNPGSNYLWSSGETTQKLLITESGSYSVIVNNGFGVAYDTVNVTLLPAFIANWNIPSQNSCAKEDLEFIDQSVDAIEWLWDFGDGFVDSTQEVLHMYQNAGNYPISLIVENSNGCQDTLTDMLNVSSVEAIIENEIDLICIGEEIEFSSNTDGITSWLWDFGDGGISEFSNPVYSYLVSGEMTVTLIVENSNDCIDSTSIQFIVENCTGMIESGNFEKVEIYPNPTNNTFKIDLKLRSFSDLLLEIIDVNGKIIFNERKSNVDQYVKEFDSNRYVKGVYFIKISSGDYAIIKRQIIY